MRQASRGAGLVVLGLAVAVAAGCASDKRMMKSGSGDIVADRQRMMKLHGQVWSDIQAKAKANNIEGIEVSAETLAINAQYIPLMFPEGTLTDKSKAKPEVWQKFPEFEAAAKKMETEAVKLRDLFDIVGRFDATEVLVDDRPVPYARELWLPLIWFLIPR